ncbi:MAG: hypothetical protein ACUVQG_00630 [Thermogutta sp.]
MDPTFVSVTVGDSIRRRYERACRKGGVRDAASTARLGLAPLELVIAVPLFLFIMALMINFATVSAWRVRGLAVARQTVWAARHPRNTAAVPRPDYWPSPASLGGGGAPNAMILDDPRVHLPVARGPVLGTFRVHDQLLDPTRGFRRGSSEISREFPLLPSLGPYQLHSGAPILDNCWRYRQTALPYWWHDRWAHRLTALYQLPAAGGNYLATYVQAALAILNMPQRQNLLILDRDPEFAAYASRFGWRGGGSPDFHPGLNHFCSLDLSLAQDRVDNLIDRIGGVAPKQGPPPVNHVPSLAERMAGAYIGLYRRVIEELQNQLNAVPPPGPGQIAAIQAEIADLQQQIDTLEAFRQSLQNHGR